MKKILVALIFIANFVVSTKLLAQNTLTVEVSNLKNNNGTIMIALFKGKNGFPRDEAKAIRKAKVTIKNKKATILFTDLPLGDYAFALFHDENKNNQMDSNILGIPKEGYGFSTNFKPKMSAPDFDEASFEIRKNTIQKIKIIN